MSIVDSQKIREQILQEVAARQLDLQEPGNSFIVANFTVQRRQGPLINTFSDLMGVEIQLLPHLRWSSPR
jgi:hypothetical protein